VEGVQGRRRVGAAAFVLLCAPCFVGFLVFIVPVLAAAVVGSVLLQSALAGAVGGGAALCAMVVRRGQLRRAAARSVPQPLQPTAARR
jgi:hypothetical protein